MKTLRIAPQLQLPLDVAGEALAILAKRGAGKTNTAAVLVEEIHKAGIQVVVLDPVGAWWGLRSSFDGKSAGLEIPIFGGYHQDAPLQPTAGALMANVAVEHRQSMVLDLSNEESFPSKASTIRFAVDFAERLYRAKGRQPSSMVLVLEEADEFAPQTVRGDVARMVGAFQQIVKRGRGRGIGSISITQRSAAFNKDILEQTDVLIIHRTTGPNDRDAIERWVKVKADGKHADVLESLPSLKDGEAWVWNPERNLLQRAQVRRRRTFDSGATPKPGERRVEPEKFAPIDLAKLGAEIEATVEREKSNDPKELRRMNHELRKRLAAAEQSIEELKASKAVTETRVEEVVKEIEVPVFGKGEVEKLTGVVGELDRFGVVVGDLVSISRDLSAAARGIEDAVALAARNVAAKVRRASEPPRSARPPVPRPPIAPRPAPAERDGESVVSGPQQRILDALAGLESIGIEVAAKVQLALFAAASPKSSSYSNNLGHLNNQMLMVWYPSPGYVQLTAVGRAVASAADAPSTAVELQEFAYGLVGNSKARLLRALVDVYPEALAKGELAERAEASATSSSFSNNLGSLRSLGLIGYPSPGLVAALPILFLET